MDAAQTTARMPVTYDDATTIVRALNMYADQLMDDAAAATSAGDMATAQGAYRQRDQIIELQTRVQGARWRADQNAAKKVVPHLAPGA